MDIQTDAERLATGQDWANHIGHCQDSNAILHVIAEFHTRLDESVLGSAVEETLRLQPVLACRFDESQTPPCWTPLGLQEQKHWFRVTAADRLDEAIRCFVEEVALEEGRLLLVQLIHGPEGDAVCIKLDHACCDGGGAKAYMKLLGGIYSRLSAEAAPGTSLPVHETNFAARGSSRVYAACGIQSLKQVYRPEKDAPVPSVTVPFLDGTSSKARFETMSIPLAKLRQREEHITVNDLLLAAFSRALARLERGDVETPGAVCQTAINLTIDLRRYLPSEEQPVVCNLSGMEKVPAGIMPDEEFGQTVKQIHGIMTKIKASNPGLHSAVSMDFLAKLPFPQAKAMLLQASSRMKAGGQSSPMLSNLGWLAAEGLRFGEATAVRAYAVTPAMHAPAFMLGASSYGNELTLVAAYFEQERRPGDIRSLLEAIGGELIEKVVQS